jgi:hypothetical protein
MVHPPVDENAHRERSRERTFSPFFRAVKGMFRVRCRTVMSIGRDAARRALLERLS